jgi:conjugative transfer pilus assembly protein TraH
MKVNQFKKIILVSSLCTSIIISQPIRADVAADLTKFVDSIGGAATSTPASIYKGQSRGYINGGRLFVRTPQTSIKAFSYKAPKFTAGCGGIDAFAGSMSFIDAAEFINALKKVATSSSYYMMLGLRTISSQIANTMEKNMSWLQDKIGFDMNSCEMAANVVGAGMDFFNDNGRSQNVCIVQTMESTGVDYSSAKESCGTGGGGKIDTNTTESRELSFITGNLIWVIMFDADMFKNDIEMKKVVMSLVGTVIKNDTKKVAGTDKIVDRDTDTKTNTIHKPPIVLASGGILSAILGGGKFVGYDCSDNTDDKYGCLDVKNKTWKIKYADSLYAKTEAALFRIYNSILDRTDPANDDLDYVAQTSIPTMRILRTAAVMSKNGMGKQIIDDYAEQIAIELLTAYVSNIAYSVTAYSYKNGLGKDAKTVRSWIKDVQSKLNEIRITKETTLQNSLQIADQLQYYERIAISALPNNLARAFAWTSGGGR